MSKPRSRASYAEAISLFERALVLDSNSVEAQSLLAINLVGRMLDFGSSSGVVVIRRADELATRALAASTGNALAHFAKGDVLRAQRRCAEGIPEYEAALALNRNAVEALATIGRCKIYTGSIEEGIAVQQKAISLSPQNPRTWIWYFRIGEGHLLQSRIDDAILWLEKARNANPAPGFIRAYLSSAYALNGEAEQAAIELAEARIRGGFSQSVAQERAGTRYETRDVRALADATFWAGLRKAGMPEE